MAANPGSTAQGKPQEAAVSALEPAEPEPAAPISAADAPSAVRAAAFLPQPVPPLLQYVPPLPQYVPPLPQYVPPLPEDAPPLPPYVPHHPQLVPPLPVMGTPVPLPWPARCAKPDKSRVVRTFSNLQAPSPRISVQLSSPPAPAPTSPLLSNHSLLAPLNRFPACPLNAPHPPSQSVIAVPVAMIVPIAVCIFPCIIGARFRDAARSETILLSPHHFSITIKLPDKVTEQRGSTARLQAVVVQDLNSPQPLLSPPVHGAGYRPVAKEPNLVCVFVEQQQDYRFGKTLSDAEKYWVVGELSHHLHSMRLHPAQEHV
ncbi:unnamed protein product [Closterium sp. NIES-53]